MAAATATIHHAVRVTDPSALPVAMSTAWPVSAGTAVWNTAASVAAAKAATAAGRLALRDLVSRGLIVVAVLFIFVLKLAQDPGGEFLRVQAQALAVLVVAVVVLLR